MSKPKPVTKVGLAQQRWLPLRTTLVELGARCMEQVIDREHGVIFERWWLPGFDASIVVHATTDGWDVFKPVTRNGSVDVTLAALRKLVPRTDILDGEKPKYTTARFSVREVTRSDSGGTLWSVVDRDGTEAISPSYNHQLVVETCDRMNRELGQ